MDTSSFLIWNMTLPIVHVECYICLKECKLHCLHFCSRTKGTRRLARKVFKLLPQSPPFSRYGPGGKIIQRSIRKVWETKSPTAIPIGSMGLVYLPTFTIKNQPNVGTYTIYGSFGIATSRWWGLLTTMNNYILLSASSKNCLLLKLFLPCRDFSTFKISSPQEVLTHLVAQPWQRRMWPQCQGVEKDGVGRAVHLQASAPHLLVKMKSVVKTKRMMIRWLENPPLNFQ